MGLAFLVRYRAAAEHGEIRPRLCVAREHDGVLDPDESAAGQAWGQELRETADEGSVTALPPGSP